MGSQIRYGHCKCGVNGLAWGWREGQWKLYAAKRDAQGEVATERSNLGSKGVVIDHVIPDFDQPHVCTQK